MAAHFNHRLSVFNVTASRQKVVAEANLRFQAVGIGSRSVSVPSHTIIKETGMSLPFEAEKILRGGFRFPPENLRSLVVNIAPLHLITSLLSAQFTTQEGVRPSAGAAR